ncbi:MAG: BlaI/MecI/CopY family transcriptional regulator [Verrucomicrobiales bacterium]|nr:BlaI/MecI/CopY family transcriptional regulator [Verrucomicrobiales bacterium]
MAEDQWKKLTKRERQIMEFLLTTENATASEIECALPDPPTNAAVRALLRVMLEKGLITREYDGPRYVYRSAIDRNSARRSLLRNLLNGFFGGSRSDLLSFMIDEEEAGISEYELEELEALIAQARQKKSKRKMKR